MCIRDSGYDGGHYINPGRIKRAVAVLSEAAESGHSVWGPKAEVRRDSLVHVSEAISRLIEARGGDERVHAEGSLVRLLDILGPQTDDPQAYEVLWGFIDGRH